jgi:aspartyl-tRNA(Asn)/glutamyl-tRNA(Gln) amidotransferase subunit B
MLVSGEVVRQETRHWDENLGETSTMRTKEEAEDYRYFREPDLVDLAPDQAWQDRVRAALGAMPAERRRLLRERLQDPTDAQLDAVEVVIDLALEGLVNAAVDRGADVTLAIARAANEVAAGIEHVTNLTPGAFTETVLMEQRGDLSATQAKTVLGELLAGGGEQFPDEWGRYRDGDDKLAQFFIGQVMKATNGQANGKSVVLALQARR